MAAIERIGWPAATQPTGRTPQAAEPGFVVPLPAPAPGATAGATATQAASAASMLTLQELGGETPQDREARHHGQDMLAELAALQRRLLGASDEVSTLQRLAELAAAVPHATDRRLAAMISAIVVRVRVELARRQF